MTFKYNLNLEKIAREDPIKLLPNELGIPATDCQWMCNELQKDFDYKIKEAILYMKKTRLKEDKIEDIFIQKYGPIFGQELFGKYKNLGFMIIRKENKNGKKSKK